jgi:hypothetical protein
LTLLVQLFNNFSAKTFPTNSHKTHQIAAHPVHHLPMGLSDDNPRSSEVHIDFEGRAGLDYCTRAWTENENGASCPTFQPKPSKPTATRHMIMRTLLILLIISQWVFLMIIQGPVRFTLTLEVVL